MIVSFSSSVETIPITDNTLFSERQELWISQEEISIHAFIQMFEPSFHQLLYFNDILTQKLNDVCRHPWMGAADDLLKVVLANVAVMVPRQNAAEQVPLGPTQSARTNRSGVMVNASGYLNCLPVYANLEGAATMRIFRQG